MPELPEVETIRRGVAKHSVAERISEVITDDSRMYRNNPGGAGDVESLTVGRRVAGVHRRGKFMWFTFEEDPKSLVVHLGMSGKILSGANHDGPQAKHEHLRVLFENQRTLHFVDPRMFGHLTVSELDDAGIPLVLSHIAPDPFEAAFDPEMAARRMRRSARPVKTLLLDQGIVSGIGNIYADEALFRAQLPGWLSGQDLSSEQLGAVLQGAKDAMGEAVEVGGTSFDALYVDTEGNPGYFSIKLAVYGRKGLKCARCEATIKRVVLDGRSHFFCPQCQANLLTQVD